MNSEKTDAATLLPGVARPPALQVEFPTPAVAVLRFTRPHERNPLALATLAAVEENFAAVTCRPEVRAVIFTGTDDVFAAGADLREVAALTPATAPAFARRGQTVFAQIAAAPQLTIAAINGYCMGGALDLALACRRRVAAPSAVFAHPGVGLGIITGWGGTQKLPRLIGEARALEMFLTARRVSAQEALLFGLVEALAHEPVTHALDWAKGKL